MSVRRVEWRRESLLFLTGTGASSVAHHLVEFAYGEPRHGSMERARWQRAADRWVAFGEPPAGAVRLLHGAVAS